MQEFIGRFEKLTRGDIDKTDFKKKDNKIRLIVISA
jgi:hypothetical protein